ncbi:hypothetical protein U0070_013613 [Myodes glareolus]|uniref:Uncharacterized protein n=1 Tax=Myodes glareolus TaxID=447135 RepID=A0AAW0JM08_MYOGA
MLFAGHQDVETVTASSSTSRESHFCLAFFSHFCALGWFLCQGSSRAAGTDDLAQHVDTHVGTWQLMRFLHINNGNGIGKEEWIWEESPHSASHHCTACHGDETWNCNHSIRLRAKSQNLSALPALCSNRELRRTRSLHGPYPVTMFERKACMLQNLRPS